MSNLDLFDDNTQTEVLEPIARFSPEAKQWGLSILEVVAGSGDRKTVLKKLKERQEALDELLHACLMIALRKAQSYARRLSGAQATEAFNGWVNRDPDLAHATGVFDRVLFDVSEVPMLPAAHIGG